MAKPNRPPTMEEILRTYPKMAELAALLRSDDPMQQVEVVRALINAVSGREVLAMVTFQPGSGQARRPGRTDRMVLIEQATQEYGKILERVSNSQEDLEKNQRGLHELLSKHLDPDN